MPIRFRCAYCNQLMGIAHRKAGAVVRCPKCSGQVVVPTPSEAEVAAASPPAPVPSPAAPPTVKGAGGLFEQDNFSQVFVDPQARPPQNPKPTAGTANLHPLVPAEVDVEPIVGPIEMRGIFLTPGLLTLAGVLIIILMGAAFFVGWIVGRA